MIYIYIFFFAQCVPRPVSLDTTCIETRCGDFPEPHCSRCSPHIDTAQCLARCRHAVQLCCGEQNRSWPTRSKLRASASARRAVRSDTSAARVAAHAAHLRATLRSASRAVDMPCSSAAARRPLLAYPIQATSIGCMASARRAGRSDTSAASVDAHSRQLRAHPAQCLARCGHPVQLCCGAQTALGLPDPSCEHRLVRGTAVRSDTSAASVDAHSRALARHTAQCLARCGHPVQLCCGAQNRSWPTRSKLRASASARARSSLGH